MDQVVGIYKTYARIDILETKDILDKEARNCKVLKVDSDVMWALFGQDTMFSTLKSDLRFLNLLIKTFESLNLEKDGITNSSLSYD